jgi:glycosyltransferase involved in cell wall biosynthesis
MLLSIVISTYNQERYIAECIHSVLQALPQDKTEIVVADDCSNDKTSEIIQQFVSLYPILIKHIRSEKNMGANANYLRGHRAAQGKFVAHIDGDDVVTENKFTQQLSEFVRDSSINLIFHKAIYFSDDGTLSLITGSMPGTGKHVLFSRTQLACWGAISVHSAFMYRRSSLDINQISLPFMEWQIAMHCLKNGNGLFINEALVRYRSNQHGHAMTSSRKGRNPVYEVHAENLRSFFLKKEDRVFLYAQAVVNALAQFRSVGKVSSKTFFFLCTNCYYFRWSHLFESIRIRSALRPREPS